MELYACSVCKEMTVTCCKHCRSKLVQFLPSSLHREVMAEKTLLEKFILMSRIWRSGSCRRTFLCMGVKSNLALAWTSYWSRVDRDLSNHWFLSGHHNAWSDQSAAISAKKKKENPNNHYCILCQYHRYNLTKKNNTLLQYIFSSTFEAAKLYFISVQNLQHLRQHLISPLTHGVSFQWLMKVKPRWKTNVCDTLHVLSEPYQLYIVELGLAYIHVTTPHWNIS